MRITDLIRACRKYDWLTPALIIKYKDQGRIEELRLRIKKQENKDNSNRLLHVR